jgi:hypothetical protein
MPALVGFEGEPRFGELVRRVYGNEEIVPPGVIIELEKFEAAIHKRELWWSTGRMTIAANPANVSHVEVFNNSIDLVAVVVGAVIVGQAVGGYLLSIDGAAGAVPAVLNALDTRNPGIPGGLVSRILNTTVGVSGIIIDEVSTIAADAGRNITFEIFKRASVAIHPTHRLCIFNETQNQPLSAFMFGYTRRMRPEESTV